MDEESDISVDAWLGKPPQKPTIRGADAIDQQDNAGQPGNSSASPAPLTSSTSASDLIEIPHRPVPPPANISEDELADNENDDDDVDKDEVQGVIVRRRGRPRKMGVSATKGDQVAELEDDFAARLQDGLVVRVPTLPEEEREEYEHLPGYFEVKRILYSLPDRQYVVKLGSGEVDLVSNVKAPIDPICSTLSLFVSLQSCLPSCLPESVAPTFFIRPTNLSCLRSMVANSPPNSPEANWHYRPFDQPR